MDSTTCRTSNCEGLEAPKRCADDEGADCVATAQTRLEKISQVNTVSDLTVLDAAKALINDPNLATRLMATNSLVCQSLKESLQELAETFDELAKEFLDIAEKRKENANKMMGVVREREELIEEFGGNDLDGWTCELYEKAAMSYVKAIQGHEHAVESRARSDAQVKSADICRRACTILEAAQ
ncbi:hypothetical protein LTR27_011973 [Elasticomyces elasticus]|nr:hypothetical protein LTR27_011973 [Elasticomyces elasticus]